MADSVKIRITGDDSDYRRVLSGLGKVTGTAIKGVGAAAKGVAAGVGLISAAWSAAGLTTVQVGESFTSTMAQVQAISGASASEMERMEKAARRYGETTAFTASEAGQALQYMALAGWDAQQSTDALGGVLNLAAASGMELGAASDMVTDYLSAFGMEASQAAYFSDMLAHAQSSSNTTAAALGEAYRNCGANLHAAGQDVETVTAALMGMANQGLKGSVAGTALAAMMRDIGNKAKDGAIQIGSASVSVQDASGNYRDLTDILTDVSAAVSGMGTAERAAALGATFTADSIRGVNLILNEGVGNIAAYEEGLRGAAGAAEEMAGTMLDNLSGDVQLLKSALEGLQLSAYEGLEGPARSAVQMATEVVTQMNEAYKRGGADGLVESITAQIPKLTAAGVQAASKLFAGVSKNLPSLVKSLLSNLPTILSSVVDLAPQLSDSLFAMFSAAVESVASQLPELVPMLLTGMGDLFTSVVDGIADVGSALVIGLADAFNIGGSALPDFSEYFDKNLFDELNQYVDGEIDTSGIDTAETTLTKRLGDLFTNIHDTLTDGLPDTDNVLQPIVEECDRIISQLYSDIEGWEAEQLAQLDPTDPEYDAKVAAIKQESADAKTEVEGLHSGVVAFINSMAGQSAAYVEEHIGELQGYIGELQNLSDQYKRVAQELSPEANAYKVATTGGANDTQTIGLAVDYMVANYTLDTDSARQAHDQAINDINAREASGEIGHDEAIELKAKADAQLELDTSNAEQSYRNGAIQIMRGFGRTLTEEQRKALEQFAANANLREGIDKAVQNFKAGDFTVPDSVRQALNDMFGPEAIQFAMDNLDSGGELLMAGYLGKLNKQLAQEMEENAQNSDFNYAETIWETLTKNFDGEDMGYDMNEFISGVLSGEIEPLDIAQPVSASAETTVENPEEPAQAVEQGVTQSGGQPVCVDIPVEAESSVTVGDVTTGEDSNIQQAVEQQLQPSAGVGVNVTADVSLSVNVTDSNASAVGTAAGAEIAAAMVTGIESGSGSVQTAAGGLASAAATSVRGAANSARTAGRMIASGIAGGIQSGRSMVVAAARQVAQAAANAIRATLQISSPSRVTREFGRFFDQGFAGGIRDELATISASSASAAQAAVSAMEGASPPRLTPRLDAASLSGAFAGAAETIAGSAERDVALYVNGRELGRVTDRDNAAASNALNRRIAVGYGK